MSRLEIYGIDAAGDACQYDEVSNAWGGAWRIWDALSVRYLGRPFGFGSGDQRVWSLFEDGSGLDFVERTALGFTFDRVWVRRVNLTRLADALAAFDARYPGAPRATLAGVVEVLRQMADDPDLVGVCFNQTSVNSDPWRVPATFEERRAEVGPEYTEQDYANDMDRDRPYNFLRDPPELGGKPVWELFEALEDPAVAAREAAT